MPKIAQNEQFCEVCGIGSGRGQAGYKESFMPAGRFRSMDWWMASRSCKAAKKNPGRDIRHDRGQTWCPEKDSNLHTLRYTDLNRARLPIPPSGQAVV